MQQEKATIKRKQQPSENNNQEKGSRFEDRRSARFSTTY